MIKMYIGSHVKYPLLLLDFNETWIFSTDFRKILISSFMKIRPVVTVVPCGQADMTKLLVAFLQFYDSA